MQSSALPWIIVIDDDPDDIKLLSSALEEFCEPCAVESFESPVEGVRFLTTPLQTLPYHIFLDINMPLLRGEECLAILRQSTHLDAVPISVMSTSMPKTLGSKLLSSRANFVFEKPSSYEEYKGVLRQALYPYVACDS